MDRSMPWRYIGIPKLDAGPMFQDCGIEEQGNDSSEDTRRRIKSTAGHLGCRATVVGCLLLGFVGRAPMVSQEEDRRHAGGQRGSFSIDHPPTFPLPASAKHGYKATYNAHPWTHFITANQSRNAAAGCSQTRHNPTFWHRNHGDTHTTRPKWSITSAIWVTNGRVES